MPGLRRELKVRRGCGYRKVGGLYLMTDPGQMAPCGILPKELHQCPTCGGGVKHKIGFSWVQARLLTIEPAEVEACPICTRIDGAIERVGAGEGTRGGCKLRSLAENARTKVGLIWIGASYYPEADEFITEAQALGMSRRVHAVPKGFTLGTDWILLAHIHACAERLDPECEKCEGSGEVLHPKIVRQMDANVREQQPEGIAATLGIEMKVACPICSKRRPGVFSLVRPARIEQIVTETQAQDEEFIEKLRKRNIEPVVVPDDDPDHQGRVERRRRTEEN